MGATYCPQSLQQTQAFSELHSTAPAEDLMGLISSMWFRLGTLRCRRASGLLQQRCTAEYGPSTSAAKRGANWSKLELHKKYLIRSTITVQLGVYLNISRKKKEKKKIKTQVAGCKLYIISVSVTHSLKCCIWFSIKHKTLSLKHLHPNTTDVTTILLIACVYGNISTKCKA